MLVVETSHQIFKFEKIFEKLFTQNIHNTFLEIYLQTKLSLKTYEFLVVINNKNAKIINSLTCLNL